MGKELRETDRTLHGSIMSTSVMASEISVNRARKKQFYSRQPKDYNPGDRKLQRLFHPLEVKAQS